MRCRDRLPPARTALAVGMAVVLVSAAARAGDAALAETLFHQARVLQAAGKIAEACEKFAESQRIDPATGTLLNLAACRETQGKLASAWADFKAAESAARRDGREDRVKFAREHLAAIEPRLSYLTVQVAPDSRVPGLDVRLDDLMIRAAAWGVPAPVDPGSHVVTATAPGRAPFLKRINVGADGARLMVEVRLAAPLVAGETAASSAGATSPSRPAPSIDLAPTGDTGSDKSDALSTAGWIIGGVGVAGLVTGTFFGLRAFSRWDDRKEYCSGEECSSPDGVRLGEEAERAATLSNIGFAVGIVGAGVGTYLLFVRSPPLRDRGAPVARRTLTPLVGPSAAGLTLGGSW